MERSEPPADQQIASVREHAHEYLGDAVALRHRLHEWPEIGNDLPLTRATVLEALEGLPIEVTTHETTSGIVGLLEGSRPGPTMLLRGDMDALPLHEDSGVEFSSKVDGCMHACGHDQHTAMLATAAKVLSERRDEIAGRVLFMFQPGEEGHHGARFMLDEGLLDVPPMSDGTESPVESAFAIHVSSAMPTGTVATKAGPLMASADVLRITVHGEGGHASEPHRARDPIPVACEIVTALQTMITRSVDPFDPAILTVAHITAGTTNNVIPATAEIEGTIRAVSEPTRSLVHESLKRVAGGIAAAHGCGSDVEIEYGYPVTSNHDAFAGFALDLARDVVGPRSAVEMPHPIMGAEDFSYVLNERPGAMVFLGATPHDVDLSKAAPNHSNLVRFDDQAMETGIALYATAALRRLAPT